MNKIKDIEQDAAMNYGDRKKVNFFVRYIRPILDGSFVSRDKMEKNLPFIFYIILLIIFFISNTFHAQDTQRRIEDAKEEVKVLRIKSIYAKSRLMESTRPTKMADLVKDMGLEESDVPPAKIIVKD